MGKLPLKFQAFFAIGVTAAGLIATAIANYAESPILAPISFLPYLLGAMFGGAHTPSLAVYVLALVVEWGLIGCLVSIPASLIAAAIFHHRNENERKRTPNKLDAANSGQ